MTDCFDVAPELLRRAATAGRAQHERLAGVYASSQAQAWDAERGWSGRSAVALSALLDHWQFEAAQHHRMLGDHHDGLSRAAALYVAMDRDDAAQRLLRTKGS